MAVTKRTDKYEIINVRNMLLAQKITVFVKCSLFVCVCGFFSFLTD